MSMSLTPRLDRSESNKIINGNFDFWQRNTSRTIVALAAVSDKLYTADRWSHTDFFTSGTITVSRSADVPSSASDATYSMSTQITAAASVAHASNNYHLNAGVYRMEGYDAAAIHRNTVTLQFWVKSSLTGLYSISLGASYDSASAKYVSTYTVNTANTWEQKSVTLTIDTSYGTFAKDATQGLFICFGLAANSNGTRLTSSLNQWLTSSGASVASTANRTDFIGTIGNTIKLAQVKLSIGSQVTDFSRIVETAADELKLCQRYYEVHIGELIGGIASSTSNIQFSGPAFKVEKRTTPVVVTYGNGVSGSVRHSSGSTISLTSPTYGATTFGIVYINNGAASFTTSNFYQAGFTADAEL